MYHGTNYKIFLAIHGPWLMTLMLVMLTSLATRAAEIYVRMGNVQGSPGEMVTVPIYVDCDVDMRAFQMFFSTDLGVCFSGGEFSDRVAPSSSNGFNINSGCIVAFGLTGSDDVALEAGNGLVAEAYLDIPDDAQPVAYTMFLSDIAFIPTGGAGSTIYLNDVTATLTVIVGAPEAYACYTPSNTTLTFYYDKLRSSRPGTTYSLNTESESPGWYNDLYDQSTGYIPTTRVVFDPSFANARPTSTYCWFSAMEDVESIEGLEYLNTSEVTNMEGMFYYCMSLMRLDLSSFNTAKVTDMGYMFYGCMWLTSLDVSSFNTAKVTNMESMFENCNYLNYIYADNGWSTAAVTSSDLMFDDCFSLVGGKGTTYDENHVDATRAHIDGGPSNPGYFTDVNAPRAYACYTPGNTTLTFYYDDQCSSRPGKTYDLVNEAPGWYYDLYDQSTNSLPITRVVFDPSFAGARPTSTYGWFAYMVNLESIEGIGYLNTSEVTNMIFMFNNCSGLTSLDLSSFNTANVTIMYGMFQYCSNLRTIYVSDSWSTAAVLNSDFMFDDCTSLVGGMGTTYDENYMDAARAHIDGGTSNPGYFTAKNAGQRGDVNGDGNVNISDVTALINYLLSHNATGLNLQNANCNQDSTINISDVTALINYLLSHSW